MNAICEEMGQAVERTSPGENRLVQALLLVAVALLFIRPVLNAPFLGPFAELYMFVYLGVLPFCVTARWSPREHQFLLSVVPILAYVLFIFLFSDGSDFEGIRRVTRSCVDIVVVIVLVHHLKRQFGGGAFRVVLIAFAIAAAIQAAAMYVMFLSPTVNSSMTSIFGVEERRTMRVAERISGFQSRGGDGLAMNQAIGALAAFVLYYCGRGAARAKYMVTVLFILAATLLAARAGVVVFIGAVAIYLLRNIVFGRLITKAKIVGLSLLLLLLLSVFVPYLIPMALDTTRGYNDPITRAFEPLRLYYLDGSVRTESSDSLMRMLSVFPESEIRCLFGNSQFGRDGSEYVPSDVGYIRFLHGVGLVGVVLSMLPFALVAWHSLATRNVHLTSLVVLGMLGHVKIVYLYSGFFITSLSLFYFLSTQSPRGNAVSMPCGRQGGSFVRGGRLARGCVTQMP